MERRSSLLKLRHNEAVPVFILCNFTFSIHNSQSIFHNVHLTNMNTNTRIPKIRFGVDEIQYEVNILNATQISVYLPLWHVLILYFWCFCCCWLMLLSDWVGCRKYAKHKPRNNIDSVVAKVKRQKQMDTFGSIEDKTNRLFIYGKTLKRHIRDTGYRLVRIRIIHSTDRKPQ